MSLPEMDTMQTEQKKSNLRLALILVSVVLVFFLGFMVKMAFFRV